VVAETKTVAEEPKPVTAPVVEEKPKAEEKVPEPAPKPVVEQPDRNGDSEENSITEPVIQASPVKEIPSVTVTEPTPTKTDETKVDAPTNEPTLDSAAPVSEPTAAQ